MDGLQELHSCIVALDDLIDEQRISSGMLLCSMYTTRMPMTCLCPPCRPQQATNRKLDGCFGNTLPVLMS